MENLDHPPVQIALFVLKGEYRGICEDFTLTTRYVFFISADPDFRQEVMGPFLANEQKVVAPPGQTQFLGVPQAFLDPTEQYLYYFAEFVQIDGSDVGVAMNDPWVIEVQNPPYYGIERLVLYFNSAAMGGLICATALTVEACKNETC
jgi:hypothetical protein